MKFKLKDYVIYDVDSIRDENGNVEKWYYAWKNIVGRCYNKKASGYKNYGGSGVTVSEEFRTASFFKKWFNENYIDGYEIDKDIKIPGNKIYSPEACCFVSKHDNRVEALKRRDYSTIKFPKGENHSSHKPKEYYATKTSKRSDFKTICSRNKWDFNSFIEILSDERTNDGHKKYYYKEMV